MEPQMDMQQLFAAAQQMQEQLMNAQQALAAAEGPGTGSVAAGGSAGVLADAAAWPGAARSRSAAAGTTARSA